MGLFGPSKPKFGRRKITPKEFDQRVARMSGLRRHEKEFVKAKLERYHTGQITQREFDRALREMARNIKDPIDRRKVARLKQMKEELFK